MKKLLIEWKHYAKEGKTCDRCSETGSNLHQAIEEARDELTSKGVQVEIKEIELSKSQMADSNSLFFNGTPLENLLPQVRIGKNNCCSCSEMTGQMTDCRTICQSGETYDEIPTELIKAALLNAIKEK